MAGLFKSENMEKGKAFFDGLEVTVTDAGYAEYDADGKWQNSSTCFYMELSADNLDNPVTQYWSIGGPADFQPSNNGNSLIAKKKLNERCNMAYLVKSLENAGMDDTVLEGLEEDASLMIGYKFRMTTTLKGKNDKYGTPTVDEILDGPQAEMDIPTEAEAAIRKILKSKGGSVALKALPKLIADATDNYPDNAAKAIRKAIMAKGFLESLDGVAVDGNNLVSE